MFTEGEAGLPPFETLVFLGGINGCIFGIFCLEVAFFILSRIWKQIDSTMKP